MYVTAHEYLGHFCRFLEWKLCRQFARIWFCYAYSNYLQTAMNFGSDLLITDHNFRFHSEFLSLYAVAFSPAAQNPSDTPSSN